MAGSHHTGRRPNRISSIGRRDARAIADGRRVAEADLRMAIYVRPKGLGIHTVKNPCNGQEYDVADMTAGATFSAGAVVVLGSFSGQPGEGILGRPPAGYGGASGYSVSPIRYGHAAVSQVTVPPSTEITWGNTFVFASDPPMGEWLTLTSGDGFTPGPVLPGSGWVIVAAPLSGLPAEFDAIAEAATLIGPIADSDDIDPIAVFPAPGLRYGLLSLGDPGVNDSRYFSYVLVDRNGRTQTTTTPHLGYYPSGVSDANEWFSSCVSGGYLYLLEPQAGDPTLSGSYPSWLRVTRRSLPSLAIEASYDIPSVTTFDGASAVGQWVAGMVPRSGGGVEIYLVNVTSVSHYTVYRRELSTGLTLVGDTKITNMGDAEVFGIFSGNCFAKVGSTIYAHAFVNGGTNKRLVTVGASSVTQVSGTNANTSSTIVHAGSSGTPILVHAEPTDGSAKTITLADGALHAP